jgi:hypothetical protein
MCHMRRRIHVPYEEEDTQQKLLCVQVSHIYMTVCRCMSVCVCAYEDVLKLTINTHIYACMSVYVGVCLCVCICIYPYVFVSMQ